MQLGWFSQTKLSQKTTILFKDDEYGNYFSSDLRCGWLSGACHILPVTFFATVPIGHRGSLRQRIGFSRPLNEPLSIIKLVFRSLIVKPHWVDPSNLLWERERELRWGRGAHGPPCLGVNGMQGVQFSTCIMWVAISWSLVMV